MNGYLFSVKGLSGFGINGININEFNISFFIFGVVVVIDMVWYKIINVVVFE